MTISALLIRYLVFLLITCSITANASVVMTNTRVIYPSDAQERTIQLTNNDDFPNVVQVWTDINNSDSTPDNADGPFLALPSIFRIEPKRGQMVRLVYTGTELPKDRESVFYLNFLQIPPLSKSNAGQNQMLVMLKNRVKIFYRPIDIESNSIDVSKKINFDIKYDEMGISLVVENNSPFFASFVNAKIISGKQELLAKIDMVEPKAKKVVNIKNQQFVITAPTKIEYTLVDDYGGFINGEFILNVK
ncbi:fimbrial biogenesis chaperone [Shewanella baltica]|uniref:fimbrial biogenesis chaperone n=1 Tax=Shewanella baltica TaxID=62322 RepID=UPI003D01D06E